MSDKQKMFEPFSIKGVKFKNRLVATAMFESGAENGVITDRIFKRYHELSEGGSGMIITGMHAVRMGGVNRPIMVNTAAPTYEADLKKIVKDAHGFDAKLIVQIQHCGGKGNPDEAYDCVAVCDKEVNGVKFHEITKEEIQGIVADFAKAALRCKNAGADGVQIHSAHGYFSNTFLSPSTNKRTDEYGGVIENRARFLFEIYDAVRAAVGEDFVVGVKFPFNDRKAESITAEESLYVCKELDRKGIDFIEVSAGMENAPDENSFSPFVRDVDDEAPFRDYAIAVAEVVKAPVISVGGYRSPEVINDTLENTKITAISLGRPLVREPGLPNRWLTDPSKATCVSCNGCFKSYLDGIINCQMDKIK